MKSLANLSGSLNIRRHIMAGRETIIRKMLSSRTWTLDLMLQAVTGGPCMDTQDSKSC